MATHYQFKKLKKMFETWSGHKVSSFPGNSRSNEYYCPVRLDSPKSQRFWVRFYRSSDKDICIFGDFAKELKTKKIETDFGLKNLHTCKEDPNPIVYINERKAFNNKWSKILSYPIKHNKYTEKYKELKNVPLYNKDDKLYIPFIDPKNKEHPLQAVEIIDAHGQKFFAENSRVASAFAVIQQPASKEGVIYIAEGLNSSLACLRGCPKGSGVICAGTISNIEAVLSYFKQKGYNVALAIEKKGVETYNKLKVNYDCLIVGDPDFDDIDDFYRKTSLKLLQRNLKFFKEKNYIALGVDKKNDVVCYIKSLDNVRIYKMNEKEMLYSDVFNTVAVPDKEVVKKFYFKVRFQCRFAGVIKPLNRVKFGIFPDKKSDDFYYWDMQNLYIIKKNNAHSKVIKIDPLSVISHDFLLCKENAKKRPDLTKLAPLTPCELKNLFEPLFMFNFQKMEYRLLVGWVIQSFLCGGLPYRTPIWITAPTGNGKSDISRRFLMHFFPEMDRKSGRNSTPKYFTREFSGKAMPLHRDEYEPNKRHAQNTMEEMEYIRASTSERFPSRGISYGLGDETISFEYCVSVLFTSIGTPRELSTADCARILFFFMGYSHAQDYEKRMAKFEKIMTSEMRYRFLLTCLQSLHLIRDKYHYACGFKEIRRIPSHKKSSVFMLVSCYNAFKCLGDEISLDKAVEYAKNLSQKETESRLLKTLLNLSLKKQHYAHGESYQLIEILNLSTEPDGASFKQDLLRKGLKIKGKVLYIHKKKAVLFFKRLFVENGELAEPQNILKELKNDGKYFIEHYKDYLKFDWTTIQEDYFGGLRDT